VPIDGVDVAVRFARMRVDEFLAWERTYMSFRGPKAGADEPLSEQDLLTRGEEIFAWLKDTVERYVSLPDDELEIDVCPCAQARSCSRPTGPTTP
jgi:hypothetical protein